MSEKEKAAIPAANPNNAGSKDNTFAEPAKTFDRGFASKTFPYFLFVLKEHGGNLSFGEYSHYLQDTTGEDWNAISPTITKLCDEGYIDADRKESIYTLTVAGYDYINSTQTPAAETKFADGDTTATQTPDTNTVSGAEPEDGEDMNRQPGYEQSFTEAVAEEAAPESPVNEAPAPQPSEESGFDLEKAKEEGKRVENTHQAGMLIYRTANQCMQDAEATPVPRDLYPPLPGLIYEGEITILFGNTGIGKSAASVQIACHIAQTDKVVYLDFELSEKQFQLRYSDNGKDGYKFPDNLIRSSFARPLNIPNGKDYNDYIIECIREVADQTGAKILVIDNMTMLAPSDTDRSKEAKPLMDRLVDLKFELDLTPILIEHTRKVDDSRPASINDLQGSKMKVNFSDAVFYIGKSAKDNRLRYIKQMKCRSSETRYDADNVAVFELVKENSFLQLKFQGYDTESNHLREVSDDDRKQRIQEAVKLKKQGMSNVEIAKQLSVSEGTVRYWFQKQEIVKIRK
ncbi:MAG: AAA family ATPase [Bacteroidales bacterium]